MRVPRRTAIPALAVAITLAMVSGCRTTERTEVLIEVEYGTIPEIDELDVEAYALLAPDATANATFLSGELITEPRPTILAVVPPAWADQKIFFTVRARRHGVVVGAGGRDVIPARGKRTELLLSLSPGEPVCGNGVLEAGEACDGTSLGGRTCLDELALGFGEVACSAGCHLDLSACHDCGNGAIEGPEECDGNDLRHTCQGLGFTSGVLTCNPDCTENTSACSGGCGDGVLDPGEQCDGANLDGKTCATVTGKPNGHLACGPDCAFDVSECSRCGNGLLEGDEPCDGAAFGGQTCADLGYGYGDLRCTSACTLDTSNCCGDGVAGFYEDCDGDDLGSATCAEVTYNLLPEGTLACVAGCRFDVSGCHNCGNQVIEGPEQCDGANLGGQTCLGLGMPVDGSLACRPDCSFDTSGCDVCGNNYAGQGEACDGNDLAGATCASATGGQRPDGVLACQGDCTFDTAGCHQCGDGIADGPEACDGADLRGLGCLDVGMPSDGTLACHGDCTYDTSACDICGDAIIGPTEACDDGNTNTGDGCEPSCQATAGWTCDNGSGTSVCRPSTCGNGSLDAPLEVCDGANLGDETCLSRGALRGAGTGLACNATCTGFDLSGCTGGAIDSLTQIQAALGEAWSAGARRTISIHGGSYAPNASYVLDECGGACSGGRPYGVVLQPLPGETVCFTPTGTFPVFDVVTGQNELVDLCFQDATQAYRLQAGSDAGGNRVVRNRLENGVTTPGELIQVESSGNAILANRFRCADSLLGSRAIYVLEQGNILAMNVIRGPFAWAIQANGFPSSTQITRIDHNSIDITGGQGGGGVYISSAGDICYRNNIVSGDTSSTGLALTQVTFASGADCGGVRAAGNVNRGHATACTDIFSECASYCNGSSSTVDLCDLTTDPGWTGDDLCLRPPSNPLIDAASEPAGQTYDHRDETPAVDYVGSGPDIGAREAGSTRRYGGLDSTCP